MWGKGARERSQVEKSPTHFVSHTHMALSQMFTSNYLESHQLFSHETQLIKYVYFVLSSYRFSDVICIKSVLQPQLTIIFINHQCAGYFLSLICYIVYEISTNFSELKVVSSDVWYFQQKQNPQI